MANIDEMKARLERLKKTKHELPPDAEEEAALAKSIVEQERRIDDEGQEALRKLATMHEARVIAALAESGHGNASVRCVYDWPTHKRTMTGGDITTGRGIIIVTAPDSDIAAKAVRKRNKVGSGTAEFVDLSPETVNSVLMKVTRYPAPDVLQVMLLESEAMCQGAYQEAMGLSGVLARVLSGKSES